MRRRTLLRLGVGSAVVLGLGGAGIALWRPGLSADGLSPQARDIFLAVGEAVLDGSLPIAAQARAAALHAHLRRLDETIAGFPRAVQQELSQLLALLSTTPGRIALAGLARDWPDASVVDVQAALQRMRTSTLELRQQPYHALRDLSNAAYFADPSAWPAMGYPGPSTI